MTREEELTRIAKKLDKMVSRNTTVRLYFDTHRWQRGPATSNLAESPLMTVLEGFLCGRYV